MPGKRDLQADYEQARERMDSPRSGKGSQGGGKKKSDLGVRLAGGFVYVAISVLCVAASLQTTVIYFAAVSGICAFEFYRMMHADAKLVNDMMGVLAAVLYPIAVYFKGVGGGMAVAVLFMAALVVWYIFFPKARIMEVCLSYFGATYMGLFLSSLIPVRQSLGDPWGGVLLVVFLCSVWFNDAGAYLVGSKFGRHKMAPNISPKKTWEGFLGGLVVSVIFWCAMCFIPGVSMNFGEAALFGVVVGTMAILGDLMESRIKRNVGVKDSGHLIPGHGGLFDRSDSMFTAAISAAFLLFAGGCIPLVF